MPVLHLEHFDGWESPGFKQDIDPDECFELNRKNVHNQLFGHYKLMLSSVSFETVFIIENCVYEQRQTEPKYTQMYVQPNPESHFVHMSEVGMKIQLDDGAIIRLESGNKLVWMLRFEKEPDKMI